MQPVQKEVKAKLIGLSVIAIIAVVLGIYATGGLALETREEWIAGAVKKLRSIEVSPKTRAAATTWKEMEHWDKSKDSLWHFFGKREDLVPIGKTDWVYYVSNSLHHNNGIGDIVIAIDSNGNFYQSDGHVCGFLSLYSETPVENFDDFLKTTDGGDFSWQELTPNAVMKNDDSR